MTNEKNVTNLTEGNILKSILLFAFPIFIGNVFQQLYNVADTAVIGNVLGDDALAAAAVAAPVYSLIIAFANGLTNGFAVVIARFFGAKDMNNLNKSVALTYLLTVIMSLILTLISLLSLNPLLKALKTPAEIIPDTEKYLRIILSFSIITMAYNMFAGMMRAVGNSLTPLYFLMISSGLNIVLDIIFVKYLSFGIAGAAAATVISQFCSAGLCLFYCIKKCGILVFHRKNLLYDKKLTMDLFTTGLSMGLMIAIVCIGSVILQRAVNSLGKNTITAHTAARKIDDVFLLPLSTLALAASTFSSQNYGARKTDRVKKGILCALYLSFIWSAFSCLIELLFHKPIIRLLTGTAEPEIIDTASKYIQFNVPFFFVVSVLLVLRSSLQGIGRKIVPIAASIIELAFKIAAVGFIVPALGYPGVCILEPVIWCICAVVVLVDFIVLMRRTKKDCRESPDSP